VVVKHTFLIREAATETRSRFVLRNAEAPSQARFERKVSNAIDILWVPAARSS
jgi:hypothetical protein